MMCVIIINCYDNFFQADARDYEWNSPALLLRSLYSPSALRGRAQLQTASALRKELLLLDVTAALEETQPATLPAE